MNNILGMFIDINLRKDFVLFHYIFYDTYIMYCLYAIVDCLRYHLEFKKNLETIIKDLIVILLVFVILICLSIFESKGVFLYFCIFSWFLTFAIIIIALIKSEYNKSNKTYVKPPKQKKQPNLKNNKNQISKKMLKNQILKSINLLIKIE
ncbi:MAG: hypothetical protein PUK41_03395 [Campylobacter hominis]|uniref:hypothetical protein n=1 Tax=Campylobacter TaxID=194 RepID=UPI0023F3039A|nr:MULTISPECIES: hypothetical protein [Campylobacter]MCI6641286.1 hypothetical protein [Campylobacter sp.]MDD7422404.1 hypothetical protein [Campylobacter hominis]